MSELSDQSIAQQFEASVQREWTTDTILALGHAVIVWSMLENVLDTLLLGLMLDHGLQKRRPKQLVLANIGLREKTNIATALAVEANTPGIDVESLICVLNKIQNDLRNRRNRIFHDNWRLSSGVVSRRRTTGSRVTRPQSRTIKLHVPEAEPADVAEIRTFIDDCLVAGIELSDITDAYLAALEGQPPESVSQFQPLRKFWDRLKKRSR